MVKKVNILFFMLFLLIFTSAAANADDVNTEKLLKRIEELEGKVEALNHKLNIYEKTAPASASEGGLVKALKDINLSGFVDTSYLYNFNHPDSRLNTARVFDTEANNFNLQAAELVIEKLPPDTGGAGFRADLFFGQDAEVITPTGSTRDQFDLEQAYVSLKPPLCWNLPFGNWQWIKVGKFVTMHGAEVIESKDNWNFTRSLLFGFAIPFTHTGIRAGYQFSAALNGYLGVNNGWDNVKDNNKTKSVEAALAWTPGDKLALNLAGMYGPEQTSNDHSQRGLIDFLLTYKPWAKWSFMLNADYAHEEDAVTQGKNGSWSGLAAYAKYDVNEWMSLINRVEFFGDRQGLRVTSGTVQDLWENTSTIEFRCFKDFITRLEYRYDKSSSNIFSAKNDVSKDHQETIALEMIYAF